MTGEAKFNTLSKQQLSAMGELIDGLAGTPIERSGEIAITVDGTRWVIDHRSGAYYAVVVDREAEQGTLGEPVTYRPDEVVRIAAKGLVSAFDMPPGGEFTLRGLIGAEWDGLSPVEQRNAGKAFRRRLESKPLGELEDWKTSDNEWHYRRPRGR